MQSAAARRPASTPLRRGAAVVAVAGGTLTLVGAAAPAVIAPAVIAAPTAAPTAAPAPAVAAVMTVATRTDGAAAGSTGAPAVAPALFVRPAVVPVAPEPDVVDAGVLVKAVQLHEVAFAAAEEQKAAEVRAEQERAAAEEQAQQERAQQERAQARDRAAAEDDQEPTPTRAAAPDCGLGTSGLGAVKSHVRDAAEFLGCLFGEPSILGVAGRAGTSDHPSGLALDFMVDRSTGDALAACALRNQDALGITYVIWEQRINHGGGWKAMEDRGSVTANHYDHVHVSFASRGGSGNPVSC